MSSGGGSEGVPGCWSGGELSGWGGHICASGWIEPRVGPTPIHGFKLNVFWHHQGLGVQLERRSVRDFLKLPASEIQNHHGGWTIRAMTDKARYSVACTDPRKVSVGQIKIRQND